MAGPHHDCDVAQKAATFVLVQALGANCESRGEAMEQAGNNDEQEVPAENGRIDPVKAA